MSSLKYLIPNCLLLLLISFVGFSQNTTTELSEEDLNDMFVGIAANGDGSRQSLVGSIAVIDKFLKENKGRTDGFYFARWRDKIINYHQIGQDEDCIKEASIYFKESSPYKDERFYEFHPLEEDVYIAIAYAYLRMGDVSNAITSLDSGIQATRNYEYKCGLMIEKCQIYNQIGDRIKLIESCLDVLDINELTKENRVLLSATFIDMYGLSDEIWNNETIRKEHRKIASREYGDGDIGTTASACWREYNFDETRDDKWLHKIIEFHDTYMESPRKEGEGPKFSSMIFRPYMEACLELGFSHADKRYLQRITEVYEFNRDMNHGSGSYARIDKDRNSYYPTALMGLIAMTSTDAERSRYISKLRRFLDEEPQFTQHELGHMTQEERVRELNDHYQWIDICCNVLSQLQERGLTQDMLADLTIASYNVTSYYKGLLQYVDRSLNNTRLGDSDELVFSKGDFFKICDTFEESDSGKLFIEFVRYNTGLYVYGANAIGEEYRYAAYAFQPGDKAPRFIDLCDESIIKRLVSSGFRSYKRANEDIYNSLIKPITDFYDDIDAIYFCPSGLISLLNLEIAYSNHQDKSGVRIHRLSFLDKATMIEHDEIYQKIALVGGPQFYLGTETTSNTSRDIVSTRSLYNTIRGGMDFTDLDGARKEVSNIALLWDNKAESVVLVGADATEQKFRKMIDSHPDIIHIATHGFYYNDRTVQEGLRQFYEEVGINDNLYDAPMRYSGLVLAGGADSVNGNETHSESNDGILLGSEIASLNLESVKLLVLSCCDTALGAFDMEGINGLQRAFKAAGVETIIMTLWKINDTITTSLMQEYYSGLIKGIEKHTAFRNAISNLQQQYPDDPSLWAPFIMLD